MAVPRRDAMLASLIAITIAFQPTRCARCQAPSKAPAPIYSGADGLGLSGSKTAQLKQALQSHHYLTAEKLLLPEIEPDQRSAHTARLLDFLGGVYFLDHDYFHAAVAWKKSQAIAPLPAPVQFSLAMAYIRLGHSDWARGVLESLARQNQKDALYPYWLGRVDFADHSFSQAIVHFKQAIALAPHMATAYDNLGLCYYHLNQNGLALQSFTKAIDLSRDSAHPSAWPYLNLAITLRLLNRPAEAETNLRTAIRLDPQFAQAHFQLGVVLEDSNQVQAAISEFRESAHLDPNYAEPHFALARVYGKLGESALARKEVQIFLRIRAHSGAGAPPADQ